MFNIKNYLKSKKIDYVEHEKWININCPFCLSRQRRLPDYEHLLGISKTNGHFKCLRCGRQGSLFQILNSIVNITYEEFRALVKNSVLLSEENLVSQVEKIIKQPEEPTKGIKIESEIKIPGIPISESIINFFPELKNYLIKRNLHIDTLKKYHTRYCGIGEYYANRIILPIQKDNKFVAFQARAIFDSEKKYDTPKNIDLKSFIFKTDCIMNKEPIYIVEGIFDAWRMEYNAIATFGKCIGKKQIEQLLELNIEKVVFTYDLDAYIENMKYANELSAFFDVGMVFLEGKDPDEMGSESVRKLKINWI